MWLHQDYKVGWLLAFNFVAISILISCAECYSHCGHNRVYYKPEDACIWYNKDSVAQTWYEAESLCKKEGGYLMRFPDDISGRAIKSGKITKTFKNSQWAWIGLKKSNTTWEWTPSNLTVENTFWKVGEPDATGVENCGMHYLGQWRDEDCQFNHTERLCENSVCNLGGGECQHVCTSMMPRCACFSGYRLMNRTHCARVKTCLNTNRCQHFCKIENGTGRGCACYPGYRLNYDGERCSMKLMCSEMNGDCDHICKEFNGTKRICSCQLGYWLMEDGRACKQRAILSILYYVTPSVAAIALIGFFIYTVAKTWTQAEERKNEFLRKREEDASARASRRSNLVPESRTTVHYNLEKDYAMKTNSLLKVVDVNTVNRISLSSAVDPQSN